MICRDTVTNAKPHAEPVLEACRRIGVDPVDALMVGDDLRDIEAGRGAGSRTAFVLYGYADQEGQLEIVGDTVLINTPEEVLGLLEATGTA